MLNRSDNDHLLFESFRHSQGSTSLQLPILHYASLFGGRELDISASDSLRQRLENFIHHATEKEAYHHIGFPKSGPVKGTIEKALEGLQTYRLSDEGQEVMAMDDAATIGHMGGKLLEREARILGYPQPWGEWIDALDTGTIKYYRLQKRVQEGRASFLLHYGRDCHTTGLEALDDMYSKLWHDVTTTEGDPTFNLERLLGLVAAREQEFCET